MISNLVSSKAFALLVQRVIEAQSSDEELRKIRTKIASGKALVGWTLRPALRWMGIFCVPRDQKVREAVLSDAHRSRYTIHPGSTKMYRD